MMRMGMKKTEQQRRAEQTNGLREAELLRRRIAGVRANYARQVTTGVAK
jgi:hypothetical protein